MRLRQFVALLALAEAVLAPAAGAATSGLHGAARTSEYRNGTTLNGVALNGVALGGSPLSMERQHEVAVDQDYDFLETPADVREYVEEGQLVQVTGGDDFVLANVAFPYARPEVRMFIERLAARYRAANGEQLVVTSLTRPIALQPANAHALSVHPAGMAVDFRVPARAKARVWLEKTLLELEHTGVVDVTREHTPPHYHVAVFAATYRAAAEPVIVTAVRDSSSVVAAASASTSALSSLPAAPSSRSAPRNAASLALLFAASVTGLLLGFAHSFLGGAGLNSSRNAINAAG